MPSRSWARHIAAYTRGSSLTVLISGARVRITDGVVALTISGWAVIEGRRAWAGKSCGCAAAPGATC